MATLPNFLIIGAQKAGTTTLYHLLRGHPAIYMPQMKEPGVFIRAFPDPVRFQMLRRPDDGRTATPVGLEGGGCYSLEEYTALFEPGATFPLRGEASTPYLPSPYAAGRIAELLPDVRLIALLREPVERAFSAYNYNRSRGMEPAGTFAEAVRSELRGERDDWVYGWRYLYAGQYADHLNRYLEVFPRERLGVFRFEALRADAGSVFADACRFLGVEPIVPVQPDLRQNETVLHRNPVLRWAKATLAGTGPVKRAVRRLVPAERRRRASERMLRALDRLGDRPAPMPDSLNDELRAHFHEPNCRLAELLDIDLSAWR